MGVWLTIKNFKIEVRRKRLKKKTPSLLLCFRMCESLYNGVSKHSHNCIWKMIFQEWIQNKLRICIYVNSCSEKLEWWIEVCDDIVLKWIDISIYKVDNTLLKRLTDEEVAWSKIPFYRGLWE